MQREEAEEQSDTPNPAKYTKGFSQNISFADYKNMKKRGIKLTSRPGITDRRQAWTRAEEGERRV